MQRVDDDGALVLSDGSKRVVFESIGGGDAAPAAPPRGSDKFKFDEKTMLDVFTLAAANKTWESRPGARDGKGLGSVRGGHACALPARAAVFGRRAST